MVVAEGRKTGFVGVVVVVGVVDPVAPFVAVAAAAAVVVAAAAAVAAAAVHPPAAANVGSIEYSAAVAREFLLPLV